MQPGRQRLVGSFNCTAGFGGAHFRHSTHNIARCRVVDPDRLTIVPIDPSAVDEGLLAEQLGVSKRHGCLALVFFAIVNKVHNAIAGAKNIVSNCLACFSRFLFAQRFDKA